VDVFFFPSPFYRYQAKNDSRNSFSCGQFFTDIEIRNYDIIETGNSKCHRLSTISHILPRALNNFPLIKSFKLKYLGSLASPDLVPVLNLPSLVNIQNLNLYITDVAKTREFEKFKSLRFPQLQSVTFKIGVEINGYNVIDNWRPTPFDDFFLSHQTLKCLDVHAHIMNKCQWKQLFLNPSALPNLTDLTISAFAHSFDVELISVLDTLATTIIPPTNQPRPLKYLSLLNITRDKTALYNSMSRIPSIMKLKIISGYGEDDSDSYNPNNNNNNYGEEEESSEEEEEEENN